MYLDEWIAKVKTEVIESGEILELCGNIGTIKSFIVN